MQNLIKLNKNASGIHTDNVRVYIKIISQYRYVHINLVIHIPFY